jgi:hypothetical protein
MRPLPPISRSIFYGVILSGMLGIVFCITHRPITVGIHAARQSAYLQKAHAIGLAMYSYENDHNGNYPDGKSSTEVFQKLMDGGYVTEPTVFYVSMPGKTKPIAGQKLKPENVCWDFTSGATANSPGVLPLFFLTGYKVNYVPGGSAVPLLKPYPQYGGRTWMEWWNGESTLEFLNGGIAAFYMSNATMFTNLSVAPNGDDSIPNFISPDFKPDGRTYRQLAPDGPMPDH